MKTQTKGTPPDRFRDMQDAAIKKSGRDRVLAGDLLTTEVLKDREVMVMIIRIYCQQTLAQRWDMERRAEPKPSARKAEAAPEKPRVKPIDKTLHRHQLAETFGRPKLPFWERVGPKFGMDLSTAYNGEVLARLSKVGRLGKALINIIGGNPEDMRFRDNMPSDAMDEIAIETLVNEGAPREEVAEFSQEGNYGVR